MSNTKLWKMRTGEKIRIKDMANSHLSNAIEMIERIYEHTVLNGYAFCGSLNGEMAIDCAEREISELEDEGPSAIYPIYDDLLKEQERRKVNPNG